MKQKLNDTVADLTETWVKFHECLQNANKLHYFATELLRTSYGNDTSEVMKREDGRTIHK
jgi:hypothetical protein